MASIAQEFEYRKTMWNRLIENGGPQNVSANVLHELGFYSGAQGIWVDKSRTGQLMADGSGIAVSLTHSGQSYPDAWSEDGVIYHYPDTKRSEGRDRSEVEATKNAGKSGLPVFVITRAKHSLRNVLRGWVVDWDDDSKRFLVLFDQDIKPDNDIQSTLLVKEANLEEYDFALFHPEVGSKRSVMGRKNQQRFNFEVFKRYGSKCAVCDLDILPMLQAAHLVPKEKKGSDDPRNGLVLCANHHLAFDAGIFAIHPENLEICYTMPGPSASELKIVHKNINHLARLPHVEALKWRYNSWAKMNRLGIVR